MSDLNQYMAELQASLLLVLYLPIAHVRRFQVRMPWTRGEA